MSHISTRTKIVVAVGLLLAAGVALVVAPARRPQLELSFVRYTNIGAATCTVLGLTNHGTSTIVAVSTNQGLSWRLTGRSGTQFIAQPWASDMPTISVQYWHEGFFDELIGMTSEAVSVVLPPRAP